MNAALALLLLAPSATAERAYYHPDNVGPHSELFGQASAHVAARFERIQAEMAKASPLLVSLDEGTALCSERAPESFSAYASALRGESNLAQAKVQAFVDTLVEDFEVTFGGAMERVLEQAAEGYELELCQAAGIHALMGRSQCEGTDLAPRIGQHMDGDEQLQADVQEILALEWPGFALQGSTQPVIPVTGVGSFVDLDTLTDALIRERIAQAKARHAQALESIEADLEEGETQAVRDAALGKAQDFRVIYEQEMVGLGEELFTAMESALPRLQKKGAPAAVGVCANPPGLGGCAGEDVTEQLVPLLLSDKKLLKALQ
jgi:hypothetical protein